MDKEPEIVLAFASLLQQSQWVNRIKKVSGDTDILATYHLYVSQQIWENVHSSRIQLIFLFQGFIKSGKKIVQTMEWQLPASFKFIYHP